MKRAGFFIIIVGLILIIITALTYFSKEKVIVNNTPNVAMNKSHRFSWSPLVGIALFGLGGSILLMTHEKPRLKRRFPQPKNV